jgi:anti-sigma-K factor RskA/putative zinc finger protein
MVYDAVHALDHPETAGWALGALDPDDAVRFEEHLATCQQCRVEVAEFTPVAKSLSQAAPAAEPPAGLEFKVVAAVRYAAMAESATSSKVTSTAAREPATSAQAEPKPARTSKSQRWWRRHWTNPLFAALAAAAVTAAAFLGSTLFQAAPVLAATIKLTAQPGFTGSGLATARHTHGGYKISLTVRGLPVSGPGQFYECWYAGPGNRPGHLKLITAGTFVVDHSGSQTLDMWSAANPADFKIMQITLERPGDASQRGKVILSGTAQAAGP